MGGRAGFESEEGFTLLELMITILIIAILIGVAVPLFLGAQERAHDRRAQLNLRNAATAQASYFAEHNRFTSDAGELEALEPAYDWTTVEADANGVIAAVNQVVQDDGVDRDGDGSYNCNVSTSNGVTTVEGDCAVDGSGLLCMVSRSASGTRFVIVQVSSGPEAGTYYNEDVDCPADAATAAGWSGTGW